MSEISHRGLRHYSELVFGESLSKVCRHEIAMLVLEEIRLELNRKPAPNKSKGRGRPTSPVGILAQRMEVHPDSVRRWTDIREVQASDYNATKLAEMAYKYSPQKLAKILRADINRRREAMDSWLRQADSKYHASPYALNGNLVTEGRDNSQKIVGKAAPKKRWH